MATATEPRPSARNTILGGLPVELTSFVGRRHELADVKRLLGTTRLLTLTGPGGAGKTRLALRAAGEMARAFPDGVCFVDLAPLGDPMLVNQAVFGALGLQDVSSRWSVSALTDHVGGKRMLLVFDNCEHLIDTCSVLVDTLLRSCPNLRVLATSREALGSDGEVRMPVPSMSLPMDATLTAPAVIASDAVALFEARAMAACPGFRLDGGNVTAVATVCRRLDGIPLALELAAVRLAALSLDELVEGLDGALQILGEGTRGAAPRQRTLAATIDWSYRLLSEEERLLWSRLSVFAGGFEQDAAKRVASDEQLSPEKVAELLAGLVAKSIVVRERMNGHERYRLLETLRQYGQELLRGSSEEDALRTRHCVWVREVAALAGAADARQLEAFDRIDRERDNVWKALEFCLNDAGRASTGVEICADLMFYWSCRGPVGDARRWLAALLDRAPGDTVTRARGLVTTASLAIAHNDIEGAKAAVKESLRIGRLLHDADSVGWSLAFLGLLAHAERRLDDAVSLNKAAVGFWQAMGDPLLVASFAGYSYDVLSDEDERNRMLSIFEEAVAACRSRGELWLTSYALLFLGRVHWTRGSHELAGALVGDACVMKRQLRDPRGVALALDILGFIAAISGAADRAARLLGGVGALRAAEHGDIPLWEGYHADHDRAVAQVRTVLGDAPYEQAQRDGAAMSREQLIAFALDEQPPVVAKPERALRVPLQLTKREMEIARLISEGMQTRQIAAKLFISDRTVETHVTNIMNKLGLASRLQLARWVISLEDASS